MGGLSELREELRDEIEDLTDKILKAKARGDTRRARDYRIHRSALEDVLIRLSRLIDDL